jgi:NAD dependent epimerase/dehydratase family enzyme
MPERLTQAGFVFEYQEWAGAVRQLVRQARQHGHQGQ